MKCIADDGVVLSRPLGGPPAGGSTPWLPQQSVETNETMPSDWAVPSPL